MRKTTPGIDRIAMQQLRAQVGAAKGEMDSHTMHCIRCKQAGSDVLAHCSTWWQWATQLHRLRRKLNRLEQPPENEQMTLPGMP